MPVFEEVQLAVPQGVPNLDRLVSRRRDNLPVVWREGDGEDVIRVSNKATGRGPSVQVPEPQGLVPGGRERKLSVRGNGNVLYKVIVSLEGLAGDTVLALLARQVPDNDGFV